MNNHERLGALLRSRSVERGDFVLAGGARSSFYIDARRTTFSSEGQFLVGTECLRVLREAELRPDCVGGLTLGADPIGCAIAHRSWLDGDPVGAFTVRKEAKAHGAGRRIEGAFSPGNSVVIVEDSLTSGGSALAAAEIVRDHGGEVLAILTLVDREAGGGERIRSAGLRLLHLYTAAELLMP